MCPNNPNPAVVCEFRPVFLTDRLWLQVQTLIPWFLMEPTSGTFVTDGFADIVKFGQLCEKIGLKIILRPGPFICDGPDYGGFPWWLTRQNTAATMDPAAPGALLRVRTADPAFLHRSVLGSWVGARRLFHLPYY